MGNRQWAMGNRQWAIGNKQWAIGNEQWAISNNECPLSYSLFTIHHSLLPIAHSPLPNFNNLNAPLMNTDFLKNKTLVADEDIDWQEVEKGIARKIMSYTNDIMLVKVRFEKGAIGTRHHHPHLQMSYIAKGVFDVSIGNDTRLLKEGDVYFAPSDVEHGVVCKEDGILIDVFSPARQDFLNA